MAFTPVTPRDLAAAPLTNAEMESMLANNITLMTDPVSVQFATALNTYLGNRHVLIRDVAYEAGHPTVLDVDQYGHASQVTSDNA